MREVGLRSQTVVPYEKVHLKTYAVFIIIKLPVVYKAECSLSTEVKIYSRINPLIPVQYRKM